MLHVQAAGEETLISVVHVIIVHINYQGLHAMPVASQVMEIRSVRKFVFYVIMCVRYAFSFHIIVQPVQLQDRMKHIY